MIDIHWIRRHPDDLDRALQKRGKEKVSKDLLDKDAVFRSAETEIHSVRSQSNQLTKNIAIEQNKENRAVLVGQAIALKEKEKTLKVQRDLCEKQRDDLLLSLPNLLSPDVPEGKNESDNVELSPWGVFILNKQPMFRGRDFYIFPVLLRV